MQTGARGTPRHPMRRQRPHPAAQRRRVRPGHRRARRGVRRHRHQPAVRAADGVRARRRRGQADHGRRLRRHLAGVLVDHADRVGQVRRCSSCAPTTTARAASWRWPRWSAALGRVGPARLSVRRLLLGVFGASLFYGDSVITPAISVLSAVEGLEVAAPSLGRRRAADRHRVILAVLFLVQRWGTHRGRPAVRPGHGAVVRDPRRRRAAADRRAPRRSCAALSPTYIVAFVADHPFTAFIAMGAVVLAITGAEALYADMGHFGRAADPAGLVRRRVPGADPQLPRPGRADPRTSPPRSANPFFLLAPSWAQLPLVVLATVATVIASQAVISGAFSVSRQAVRLGFLPHLTVRHTSTQESGQIYVPGRELAAVRRRDDPDRRRSAPRQRLATPYGFAVTGTFLIDHDAVPDRRRRRLALGAWKLVDIGRGLRRVELAYFGANLTKIAHGGWLPLLIAAAVSTVMTTWQRGRRIVTERRRDSRGRCRTSSTTCTSADCHRVPGTAVFPHPTKETTPLALRANVEFNHVLHEHVVIVSVQPRTCRTSPRTSASRRRARAHRRRHRPPDVRFGFQDDQDIPAMLRLARGHEPRARHRPRQRVVLPVPPHHPAWGSRR